MWTSKGELRERIEKLETTVKGMDDVAHQMRRVEADIESLTKRVRDLASGGVLSTLISEAVAKVDKQALVKEVTDALRAEAMVKAGEVFQATLKDWDYIGEHVDEDRVQELVVEGLVEQFKDILKVDDLASRVAEELVQGDHLDLGEIEHGVVEDVTERIEVTVSLSGNGQG